MKLKTNHKAWTFMLALLMCFNMLAPAAPVFAAENQYDIVARIATALDDIEERPDGSLDYDSSDLEITYEGTMDDGSGNYQQIGLRFSNLQIPVGATITSAYIQFCVDEPGKNTDPFSVNIFTEDTENSQAFANVPFTVSTRVKSESSVLWSGIPMWTVEHESGTDQQTPDLKDLVQDIVDKDGWAMGNAISFIMQSTDSDGVSQRTAESFDGSGSNTEQIPALYITFSYDGTLDQLAPIGLTGIAPTTDDELDGIIMGTTDAMEYRASGEELWTACTGTEIAGLTPDTYEVRYAETTGYNASPATEVVVPPFVYVPYAAINITFQPGSDESEMNFTWYSNHASSTESIVQIVEKDLMVGDTFPEILAIEFTGTITDIPNNIDYKSNEVSVTGLDPEMEYVYRMGDGEEFTQAYDLTTQDAFSYNAILVGDPQIGSGGYLNGDEGWANTVNTALSSFPNTSFILSAGDQVNTSSNEEEYASFFAPEELASIALIPAIGNHDDGSLYQYHYNSPNESATNGTTSAGGDYWFAYGNTLYMVLNSNNQSALSHEVFMEDAIAQAGSGIQWKVVMFHHSIYSSGTHSDDSSILSRRSDLYPIFDTLDIDVVLMGHDHYYTRSYQMEGGIAQNSLESSAVNPVGTLYITANSGSGSKYYDYLPLDGLYAAVSWQEDLPSFSNIQIDDNTFRITTYESESGDVIDDYTIIKDQTGAPEGLAGVAPTTEVNEDGKISGTTAGMEYKLTTETAWTACTDIATGNLTPGLYDVRYTDGASVSTIVEVPAYKPAGIEVTVVITDGMDDVEEAEDGSMDTSSSDLEITVDGDNQQVGLRFDSVAVPKGAIITGAYIQFSCDEDDADDNSETFNVNIYAEDVADSSVFTEEDYSVSSRVKSAATVLWSGIPAWAVHAGSEDERTPDLMELVQNLVNMEDWTSGNAMTFILTGDGVSKRVAESFDGAGSSTEQIPTLHVFYIMDTTAPVITVNMDDGAELVKSGTLALNGEATDDIEVASFTATLDGNVIEPDAVLDLAALATGAHTLVLTAEDTAGNTTTKEVSFTIVAQAVAVEYAETDEDTGIMASGLEEKVNIPEMSDENVEKITVSVKAEEMDLDASVVAEIIGKGYELLGAFDIKLYKTIDRVEMLIDSADITGPISVWIPLTAEQADMDNLAIAYVDDEGNIEIISGTVEVVEDNTYFVFETEHFSTYALVAAVAATEETNPKTGIQENDAMNTLILCLGAWMMLVIGASLLRKRRQA